MSGFSVAWEGCKCPWEMRPSRGGADKDPGESPGLGPEWTVKVALRRVWSPGREGLRMASSSPLVTSLPWVSPASR